MSDSGGMGYAGAGVGFGSSLVGSLAQNESIRRAGSANREATKLKYGQIDDAAKLEIQKRANETQRIRSRMRVLSADSGFDNSGSFLALDDQAVRDQAINDAIIKMNAYNAKLNAGSELKARLIELYSKMSNPLMEGFQGGVAGYGSGSEIGRYVYGKPTGGNVGYSAQTTYSGGYGIDPALVIGGGYNA